MRTTLTLDDDVAEFLKEQARLLNKPFKQVLNETVRRGMSPASPSRKKPAFKIVANSSGLIAGVDPRRLNQLNEAMEVEDFIRESGE